MFYHYNKWLHDGTWQRVNRHLCYLERQQRGRLPHPSAAIVDSQSVKTTESGGPTGYDGGKHVKGRKRHILTDTVGNLLEVVVHTADIQDRVGMRWLIEKLSSMTTLRLQHIWADQAYTGTLVAWLRDQFDMVLEIVLRSSEQVGFQVLPRRWVVERTFAWLGRYRRLSKDFECRTKSSEAMIYLASIHIMLKRLTA